MPVNYQLGKIYKIISNSTDKIYIGSTVEKYLTTRLAGHIRDYNKCHFVTSFELLKYNDYQIVLIEKYPCNDKDELRAREQYWINNFKENCVNCRNAKGFNTEKRKK